MPTELTFCVHCRKPDVIEYRGIDGCHCLEADCGHIIGPDTDDLPPCEDEGFCEHCCTCEPEEKAMNHHVKALLFEALSILEADEVERINSMPPVDIALALEQDLDVETPLRELGRQQDPRAQFADELRALIKFGLDHNVFEP
jgi:hypothetical protein